MLFEDDIVLIGLWSERNKWKVRNMEIYDTFSHLVSVKLGDKLNYLVGTGQDHHQGSPVELISGLPKESILI